MRTYVFSHNPLVITQYDALQFFDTQSIIRNWYTPFAGLIFIASISSLNELQKVILTKYSFHAFFLSEINSLNSAGNLDPKAWEFINQPKSSGRWESILATGFLPKL